MHLKDLARSLRNAYEAHDSVEFDRLLKMLQNPGPVTQRCERVNTCKCADAATKERCAYWRER